MKEVEALLQRILTSSAEYEYCNLLAAEVKKKRKEKFLKLVGKVNIIERNRESVHKSPLRDKKKNSSSLKMEDIKISKVQLARSQREDEDLKRKFLLINRREINHQHVILKE